MKEVIHNDLNNRERYIVDRVKTNPKAFYSYAKSHATTKRNITMLFTKNGDVATEETVMANILQDQFSSVFSDPSSTDIREPYFDPPQILTEMRDDLFCHHGR